MSTDHFEHKAETYDQDTMRVRNVENIANAVITTAPLAPWMHLMDFGAGTGLLLERIAPHVEKISAVDISSSMCQQLTAKKDSLFCDIEIMEIDLVASSIENKFDGIMSSMTMHHIADTQAMFNKFYSLLVPGGFIAIADLDSEDGSFHTDDTGVQHWGFDRAEFAAQAEKAGFSRVAFTQASIVQKPHGNYPVFLLTAIKA